MFRYGIDIILIQCYWDSVSERFFFSNSALTFLKISLIFVNKSNKLWLGKWQFSLSVLI